MGKPQGQTTIISYRRPTHQQSGIQAGDGGFQVTVKGNTDLKGAVIASTDKAITDNKNSLATGTLTTSDLQNSSSASAEVSNTTLSSDMLTQGKYGMTKAVLMNGLGSTDSSSSSTGYAKAAISGGTVIITDDARQRELTGKSAEKTVAGLNRDTAHALLSVQKQDVEGMEKTVVAEQAIKQETIKMVTALTDEAYRSRFQQAPKLIKVVCPEGADCVNNPSLLVRTEAKKDEIAKAPPGSIVAVNGIFNDERRGSELAYQNTAPLNEKGDKASTVYLMHIAPAANMLSELMAVAYEKIVTSADYGLANFLGYTNGQEVYAALLASRGNLATTSLGHSRGTLVQESAFTILNNRPDENGNTYPNPNLMVRGVGGAANAESYSAEAAKVVNDPKNNKNITFSYFSNDPVAVTAGGNKGTWTLSDLWQVIDTSNSVHSSYGSGATKDSAQVETPVPNGPQGTPEGNAKLIRYVGGQQVDAKGNPIQQVK